MEGEARERRQRRAALLVGAAWGELEPAARGRRQRRGKLRRARPGRDPRSPGPGMEGQGLRSADLAVHLRRQRMVAATAVPRRRRRHQPHAGARLLYALERVMRRRLTVGVVAGLLIVCPAARAAAPPPVLPQRVITPNFAIHYTTDSSTQDAISADTARLVGDNAEKALATEGSAFGFGPRPIEADGHIDIYVYE